MLYSQTKNIWYNMEVISIPDDIKRLIFEQAAICDVKTALELVLVSRCSQEWIERFIYDVIPPEKTVGFIDSLSKPTTFYAQHVKAICLGDGLDMDALCKVLSICTELKDIACWIVWDKVFPTGPTRDIILAELRSNLRPYSLSTDLEVFLGLDASQPVRDHPALSRLTRLDIVNDLTSYLSRDLFDMFPCMTHCSLDIDYFSTEMGSNVVVFIKEKLLSCRSLRVLLIFNDSYSELCDELQEIGDPRMVVAKSTYSWSKDWYASAKGLGTSLWDLAGEKVEHQMSLTREDLLLGSERIEWSD